MKYHQWKHLTKLKLKRRSGALRRLDIAIKEYQLSKGPMKLGKLRLCFDAWVNKKGGLDGAWMDRPNDRNCRNGVTKLSKQLNGEPVTMARDFMEAGLDNARLGIIYFFSKLQFQFNDFKLLLEAPADLMGNVSTFGAFKQDLGNDTTLSDAIDDGIGLGTDIFKTGTILSTDLTDAGLQGVQENTPATARLRRIVDDFIKSIWSALIDKFKLSWDNAAEWVNLGVNILKSVAMICVGILAKKVAPFIGGGLDILGGVAKIFKGLRQLIVDKWRGSRLAMLPGHPSTIYNSLRLHMSRSMFKGFYEVIKGATSTAVDAISAGLSAASYGGAVGVMGLAKSIAGLVLSVLELIAKFMYRLVEGIFIKLFMKQARKHWETRGDQIAIHRSHERFNDWYRKSAIAIPAIAALTINGSICGDSMRFLQVVNDDGGVVSQAQFTAGCKHLDSLKGYGAQLISDSGWHFYSKDPMVKGALERAQRSDGGTWRSAGLSIIENAVGA
jgi:hypothetical protein